MTVTITTVATTTDNSQQNHSHIHYHNSIRCNAHLSSTINNNTQKLRKVKYCRRSEVADDGNKLHIHRDLMHPG